MARVDDEELAEAGYTAYGHAVEWRAYTGQPMLVWAALPLRQRAGWRAATAAVRAALDGTHRPGPAGAAPAGG
jgi:hypothetical protein